MRNLLIAAALVLYVLAVLSGLTPLLDLTAVETLGLVAAGLAFEAVAKLGG